MSTYYVKFPKMQKSDLWAIKKNPRRGTVTTQWREKLLGVYLREFLGASFHMT